MIDEKKSNERQEMGQLYIILKDVQKARCFAVVAIKAVKGHWQSLMKVAPTAASTCTTSTDEWTNS